MFICEDDLVQYTYTVDSFRSVRNFVIDLRQQPASTGTGIHWYVCESFLAYAVSRRFQASFPVDFLAKYCCGNVNRPFYQSTRHLHGERQRWLHGR